MSAPTDRPRLVLLNTVMKGMGFPLTSASSSIGRGVECAIQLDFPSVSRVHARVDELAGRFIVRDLDSRNGIRIGERQVKEAELTQGAILFVGEVQLRFERPEAALPVPTVQKVDSTREGERRLSAADLMSLAKPRPAAGGPGGQQPQQPQQPPPPVTGSFNWKIAASVAVGLIVVVAFGGLLLARSFKGTVGGRTVTKELMVKVGQKCWVRFPFSEAVNFETLRIGDQALLEVQQWTDTDREMLFIGMQGGVTTVTVRGARGNTAVYRVLVRGYVDDEAMELQTAVLFASERLRMANTFLRNGNILLERDDKPYLALMEYRKANAALAPLEGVSDLDAAISTRMSQATQIVDSKWARLRSDFRTAAESNDRPRQLELVNFGLTLIPDENDPRNQKLMHYLGVLRYQEERERAARRRR